MADRQGSQRGCRFLGWWEEIQKGHGGDVDLTSSRPSAGLGATSWCGYLLTTHGRWAPLVGVCGPAGGVHCLAEWLFTDLLVGHGPWCRARAEGGDGRGGGEGAGGSH